MGVLVLLSAWYASRAAQKVQLLSDSWKTTRQGTLLPMGVLLFGAKCVLLSLLPLHFLRKAVARFDP